ncbi:copper amine oxidase N-terminal domain-containing protein [Paenibacillus sp. WQ 127069]|uniref:Copper amine oxidase N-terminal domain-containing protein n=1 Tax=Paenibacillus baimaensis TaxID=2982185 RepID=A0ABT2UQB8_9BACL|nr:copper amine oxidase N-terminal domain-containing protein [Paenibacillus sp. WQ 127069]MCU6796236.1 copper amine oxidase N-terminal domain-containing protein [Paenibacillus sp. WQ 127069]
MKMKKLLVPVLSLSMLVPVIPMTAYAETVPTTMMATVNTPAADLRAALDNLLSEHFVLAVTAMTKAYDGSPDAAAAYKALDQNALDMQPAIASLYGDAGGIEFERIFRAHNKYTDDVVKGLKANDPTAVKKAQDQIQGFVVEFAKFLATATDGKLPEQAAADVIRSHEKHVQDTFDSYVKGDYSGAYDTFRVGFNEMFAISKALATAITTQMPEKFANSKADTPAADLRSALNSLASEHFALSALEMPKQYEGSKDYSALIRAEAGNTVDFKAAVTSIYGVDGGIAFEKIWVGDHINAQSDIVIATKNGDTAALMAAKQRISKFVTEFGAFLGTATGENLPTKGAQEALRAHEDQVQLTFDQYVARNYDASYATFREGYKFMFGVGQALGGAIVTQNNAKFQMPMTTTPAPTPTEPVNMTKVWMKLNSNELKINDKMIMMDTAPFMSGDNTYIPLRYLSEGIGAEVTWNDTTKEVGVKAGSSMLKFWIGKDYMEVNGVRQNIGAQVYINKDGRTVVPLRFITELLGWTVTWNEADNSVTLTQAMK